MGKFLDEEKVHDIINETYGFVEQGNLGNLTLDEFQELCTEILPDAITFPKNSSNILKNIFNVFTGSALEILGGEELKSAASPINTAR